MKASVLKGFYLFFLIVFLRIDEGWGEEWVKDDENPWKKCKGDVSTGRCFCYYPGIGAEMEKRIFGWDWWKNAENMTCACSKRRYELEKVLGRTDVSLHCTENGNFEELQCDNDLCWCVEAKTGKPVERMFPEAMMTYLPCYKNEEVGLKYWRQCESKKMAVQKIKKKLQVHGRLIASLNDAICDGDGSYGVYKIQGKMAYCTWKDSSRLENYQSYVGNLVNMTCNCARDNRIFADENLENVLVCIENGNYDTLQYLNDQPFCVDSDGFAIIDLGNSDDVGCPKNST